MKDIIAAALSGLCIVHCLATPILLLLGSSGLMLGVLSSEWFHYLMLLPISVLLAWSLPGGWCVHKHTAPFVLGLAGFLLLIISLFASHYAETALSLIGGGLLIGAHLYNRQLLLQAQGMQHAAHSA
ncbi:MerC domain-containing protein [Alishewanella sp. SMS8]|uniref:MerC domain-containing protein n=1 Tax=Alishewanella sp. SMS8 TaxID=2994676 RepID=UPI00274044CA|nr:MerC domain-containing protein [Alishewanella sp. SMS8]MDP4945682.1 MerC domain-containing protein [Alishewanella sp.]MDP5207215.1 MerC domain-containing protein [Alishewanella sp. SMS9]MDP5459079.1 MerC domain-containing protein [Alishewanella sp. SMS8]